MKTIAIKTPEALVADVVLETAIASCNFCGEAVKQCVRGSVPLRVFYGQYEIEDKVVYVAIDKPKLRMSIFGERYYKIKDWDHRRMLKEGVPRLETKTDTADICKDCILSLAKLVK